MKLTYYLYVHKSGEIRVTKEKESGYDARADWVELKNMVEIPNHMFEKPTTTVTINVTDKYHEKNQTESHVHIDPSFGSADLRRPLEKEQAKANNN